MISTLVIPKKCMNREDEMERYGRGELNFSYFIHMYAVE